jgi:hypothetical protein
MLTARHRSTTLTHLPTKPLGVVGRFRAANDLLPRTETARQQGDGLRILGLAAQRLTALGLTVRAAMLRGIADRGGEGLRVQAEATYDALRRETPDSDRAALLTASSTAVAHRFAQGLS